MTKVLVSGLSVGNDVGVCQACGFDFEWLLRYPSVVLWVDRILLTTSTWDDIRTRLAFDDNPFDKSMALVFELLHSAGLIEVIDTHAVLSSDVNKAIVASVDNDVKAVVSQFPDVARLGDESVPGQVFIQGDEYCAPYLYSVYASLLLAKALDAQCLFNRRVLNYCNYKFGLGIRPAAIQNDRIESFHSVFQSLFPNDPFFPEYAIYQKYGGGRERTCDTCRNERKCSDSYLAEVEAQVKNTMSMREREEIEESRNLIDRIIDRNSGAKIDPIAIEEEFLAECRRLSRRSRKVFSRTKYWCSLSMILSVPLTVTGLSTQTPALLATGAAAVGVATGLKHLMDSLQEKYRWTAYFNRELRMREEKVPISGLR